MPAPESSHPALCQYSATTPHNLAPSKTHRHPPSHLHTKTHAVAYPLSILSVPYPHATSPHAPYAKQGREKHGWFPDHNYDHALDKLKGLSVDEPSDDLIMHFD